MIGNSKKKIINAVCFGTSKSKDFSEGSSKINDSTRISKLIESNNSNRLNSSRTTAYKIREKKKLEGTKSSRTKLNFLDEEFQVLPPKAIDHNQLPNKEENSGPYISKKKQSEIIPNKSQFLMSSQKPKSMNNSVTSNQNHFNFNQPEQNNKNKSTGISLTKAKTLEKSSSAIKISSRQDLYMSNNGISPNDNKKNKSILKNVGANSGKKPLGLQKSLNNSKSLARCTSKSEISLEVNSIISETMKKIPNLKKNLEKNLKRPLSMSSYCK
jgi:hypothetical protein